jgi:hypothetical protein
MSTLKISSKRELLNILRSYKVYVDGKLVGKVQNGKIQNFELEPGSHKVYAKLDFFKSNEIEILINENEVTEINLKGSDFIIGAVTFYIIVLLFITITKYFLNINTDTKFPVFIFLFAIIFKDAILKIQEVKK